MPTAREKILAILTVKNIALCDDCISKLADVTPRQQVNIVCRPLGEAKITQRSHGSCGNCGRSKLVNKISAVAPGSPKPNILPPISKDRDKMVNDIHYDLMQLLQRLKPLPKHIGPSDHINQLLQENSIPNHIATLMHSVRKLRNDFTKERVQFSDSVFTAIEANWIAIREWAQK